MSTSLSQQLKRLAVPQTSVLRDSTRRVSILFDSKDAATKDRRTIFELGVRGLRELTALNPSFQQFELTLFVEASLHLERSVENKDVNRLLDRNIKKFLQHLSPYFLLSSAHMCLEWLLRRFQIHQYNTSALLALALPYHETTTFVRVLQTLRVHNSDEWSWLHPLRKPGVPLSKSTIINRAASNPAFLAFVCNSATDTILEFGSVAHLLQAQINFYASVVVGALQNAPTIEEWHVTTLLKSLLLGLGSDVIDFVSAAYIVTAQLVARTQLTPKLCNALIKHAATVSFERLHSTAVLLLIWIFDTQEAYKPCFTERSLKNLVQHKRLTIVLSSLVKENVAVQSLCVPLLSGSVAMIRNGHEDSDIYKLFLERMLSDIEFPLPSIQQLISCFLDCYVAVNKSSELPNNDGVIELNSDDDEMTDGTCFEAWYSDYLRKVERKYPEAFDIALKEALQSGTEVSSNRKAALKMALGFRLKSFGTNATDIYENLYHYTANVRQLAIRTLIANLSVYQAKPQNYELLKECLADRISDDSELVVAEVLKLETSTFVAILGYEKFVGTLFDILYKSQIDPKHWGDMTLQVIQHLTAQQIVENYDANVILLALMPLFCPNESNASVASNAFSKILKSSLVNKFSFLKNLRKKAGKQLKDLEPAELQKQFMTTLSSSNDTPTMLEMYRSVQTQSEHLLKSPIKFSHYLLLMTACLKEDLSSAQSLEVFQQVHKYSKNFKMHDFDEQERQGQQFVSVKVFLSFVVSLIQHTRFDDLRNWDLEGSDLGFFLLVLNILTNEAFSKENAREKLNWTIALKECVNLVLTTTEAKFDFFTNFYAYSETGLVDNYSAFRLRAFKLFSSAVANQENKCLLSAEHIFKITTALTSTSEVTRNQTLETLKTILQEGKADENFKLLIYEILERCDEICMDREQFPLIFYIILNSSEKNQRDMRRIVLREVLNVLTPQYCLQKPVLTCEILKLLKHFNNEHILSELIPLATAVLDKTTCDATIQLLDTPYSLIYQFICERFDSSNIGEILIKSPDAWQMIEKSFEKYEVHFALDGKLLPVPCLILNVLDGAAYKKMASKYKIKLIQIIVQTVAIAGNHNIFSAAHKFFKQCTLHCESLIHILENMQKKSGVPQTNRKSALKRDSLISQLDVNTQSWREGVVLLELLESKEELVGSEKIIPTLFDLLKVCLEVAEQSTVEYTKQLILSALLNCFQTVSKYNIDIHSTIPKSSFRIDQVVHCLRATQNPQTHHNALLLLAHCATLLPQLVLHNILDIFTFMGSSVARLDDAFSFHIITNVIESIIPILVKEKSPMVVIPVLKVFSDIMLDVPEHRRLPLYTKLLLTLGVEEYLWTFLSIVFEAHIIEEEKERVLQNKTNTKPSTIFDEDAKRIEIAFDLTSSFTPKIMIETCIQLMSYLQNLPLNKETVEGTVVKKPAPSSEASEISLFDIKYRSGTQLRHYKYVILQFLSTITKSEKLLRKTALLSGSELKEMKPSYQNLIIQTLSFVPIVQTAIEKSKDNFHTKFWKVVLHHLFYVLHNAISLLTPEVFLLVVNGLMKHKLLSIRKAVIELLNTKLQQNDSLFDACDEGNFQSLLQPLNDIVASILRKDDSCTDTTILSAPSNELVLLQQTALISIKLLSKLFALKYIESFKAIISSLTKIIRLKNISKIISATVVLTIVEISCNLKAHSLSQLPKYMPQLIKVLQQQVELVQHHPPDNVCIAVITGIQKLFETLPLFLGPYMEDVITTLCTISTSIAEQQSDSASLSSTALHKISSIWTKIATDAPIRVVIPSCANAYNKLLDSKRYEDITVLMKLVHQAISSTKTNELATVQTELGEFLRHTLEFRLQLRINNEDQKRFSHTEETIIDAFVAWILKLSESSFRPLYHNVYEWALKRTAEKEAILTYFLLTSKISEALKSLFVLFASDFVDDAARLLDECNTTKHTIEPESEYINSELLRSILSCLRNVFLHDTKSFVNTHRFEVLMPAIVDQLENRLVLENEPLQQILSACISQLAVAVSSDILWKQLNYQVLLKTRTNVPEVRISAFNCCVEIARKLGEDFTSLLPETVPFIAELFEDENPRVEKNARKSVQELELILGESIQNYL